MSASVCAGIVLCGGASSRMGRPKADLVIDGESLLNRTVRMLRGLADPIILAAGPDQPIPPFSWPVQIVRDAVPAAGPLAAFCGALAAIPIESPSVYLLGCDLPFLTPELLRLLDSQLAGADAAVPFVGGIWHPLAALYARRIQDRAASLLTAGKRSMWALLDVVNVAPLDEEQIRRFDPALRCLRNINTPEDFADALRDAER
jgi:molybdenum cofactor guanylyltransferase